MDLLLKTLPTLSENLALDEALLLEAEAGEGGEVLRLWEWSTPAVVLGAGCRLAEDVFEDACRRDGVRIGRRASGGGTVLLDRGCLCYSLVLAYARDPALREITSSYAVILGQIAEALRDVFPEVGLRGTSDLAAEARKFSGNAQQRKRDHLLHHGTLLYAFDVDGVARYLRPPPREPEYRQGREHAAFLRNLPVPVEELYGRLRAAWEATTERTSWPSARVFHLVLEKYATADWVRRR